MAKRTGKTHENLEAELMPAARTGSSAGRQARGDRSGPIGISGGDFTTPTARKRTTTQPRGLPVVSPQELVAHDHRTPPPVAHDNGTPRPVAREGALPDAPFAAPSTTDLGDSASRLAAEAAAVRALDSGPLTPPPVVDDPGPTPPPVVASAPHVAPVEVAARAPSLADDASAASQLLTPPPAVVDTGEPVAFEPPIVPGAALDVTRAVDASPVDASPVDASPVDASPVDASPVDASPVDGPSVDGPSVVDDAAASPGAIVPDAVAALPLDGAPAPLSEVLPPAPPVTESLAVSGLDGTSARDAMLEVERRASSSQETPWPELTAPTPSAPAEVSRAAGDEPEVAPAEDLEEVDGADADVTEPLDTLPAEALSEATPMAAALEPPAPPRPAAAPPPLPAGSPRRKTGETRAPELPAAQVVASIVPPIPAGAATLPEALAQRPRRPRRSKPWFEEVFDEDYLRTLPFMSADQTLREVEFIESSLGVKPGGQLLDIGCGYGRHAIELAQRGLDVTGLDLSLPLLLRAADEAQKRSMSVNFVHADMREMAFEKQFDGIYSMLTSFGYFDEETNLRVAEGIARALKPGGRFLLDIVNRDYVVSDLPSRVWWEGNGCVVLEEVDFNFHTSRILTHRSIVFEDGRQIEQEISVRAYSLHEIGRLLRQAGFRVVDISGSLATRGHFFGATSRNLFILAEKRTEET